MLPRPTRFASAPTPTDQERGNPARLPHPSILPYATSFSASRLPVCPGRPVVSRRVEPVETLSPALSANRRFVVEGNPPPSSRNATTIRRLPAWPPSPPPASHPPWRSRTAPSPPVPFCLLVPLTTDCTDFHGFFSASICVIRGSAISCSTTAITSSRLISEETARFIRSPTCLWCGKLSNCV